MALQLDDPLSQSIYGLGLQQTQPWDPTQEAARKDQAWGQTQQKVGERYSRAGLTGSSQELGDLANTAKNFELDWGERAPKQRADALTSVLPIQNFRRGVANDVQGQSNWEKTFGQNQMNLDRDFKLKGENQDTAMWANLLASSGLPSWLASVLFGTSTPAAGGGGGGLVGAGGSALWKLLGGGGGGGTSQTPENLAWLFGGGDSSYDIADTLGGGWSDLGGGGYTDWWESLL